MSVNLDRPGSCECFSDVLSYHFPSKLRCYGFAVAIIVGLGGLAVGAAGLASYYHVGALSSMAQIDAVIMMSAGGGAGVILLTVGIVGAVKNQLFSAYHNLNVDVGSKLTGFLEPTEKNAIAASSVYGPKAWNIWNIEIKDKDIPEAPKIDFNKQDAILLYIPKSVSVNGGKEKELTLKALKEIRVDAFKYFNSSIEEKFGTSTSHGWILIDTKVITESLHAQSYKEQAQIVAEKGCRMPTILEASVCHLMFFAFTGIQLCDEKFICCLEKMNEDTSVIVGKPCRSEHLSISRSLHIVHGNVGTIAVKDV